MDPSVLRDKLIYAQLYPRNPADTPTRAEKKRLRRQLSNSKLLPIKVVPAPVAEVIEITPEVPAEVTPEPVEVTPAPELTMEVNTVLEYDDYAMICLEPRILERVRKVILADQKKRFAHRASKGSLTHWPRGNPKQEICRITDEIFLPRVYAE